MKIKKETAIKILAAALTALVLTMCMGATVFATSGGVPILDGKQGTGSQQVQNAAQVIIGIVQIIAGAAAVIMLIVLGIRYVSADPNGKADVKKMAITYVIGAVLLFGATGLLQILKQFAGDFTTTK